MAAGGDGDRAVDPYPSLSLPREEHASAGVQLPPLLRTDDRPSPSPVSTVPHPVALPDLPLCCSATRLLVQRPAFRAASAFSSSGRAFNPVRETAVDDAAHAPAGGRAGDALLHVKELGFEPRSMLGDQLGRSRPLPVDADPCSQLLRRGGSISRRLERDLAATRPLLAARPSSLKLLSARLFPGLHRLTVLNWIGIPL